MMHWKLFVIASTKRHLRKLVVVDILTLSKTGLTVQCCSSACPSLLLLCLLLWSSISPCFFLWKRNFESENAFVWLKNSKNSNWLLFSYFALHNLSQTLPLHFYAVLLPFFIAMLFVMSHRVVARFCCFSISVAYLRNIWLSHCKSCRSWSLVSLEVLQQ